MGALLLWGWYFSPQGHILALEEEGGAHMISPAQWGPDSLLGHWVFVEGSDDIMEYWCSSEWGTVGLSETSLPEETQYRSAELVAVLASASGEIPRSFENQSTTEDILGGGTKPPEIPLDIL